MSIGDWWEYSIWGAKRNGANDGARNIPDKTQTAHAAYERQHAMRASKQIRGVATEWEKADQRLKGSYVAGLRNFLDAKERSQKEGAEAEAILSKHRTVTDDVNRNTNDPHMGRKSYLAIMIFLAIAEIPLTAQVFEIFGENKVMTYVFALVLCISVPMGAHLAGLNLKEKFSGKDFSIFLTLMIALLAVLGSVSYIREKFFESQMQDLLGVPLEPRMVTLAFFAIQFFIFAIATIASYYAHDGHPDRKRSMRELETTAKELKKETIEAQDAVRLLNVAANQLANIEAQREKSFAGYRSRAEEIIEDCKMMIETYRGENVRARGDSNILSFATYPEVTIPDSLITLDMECGKTLPEVFPIRCPICGEENSGTLTRCKKCGNDLRKS